MNYTINLSEQSDRKLHQMCDPPQGAEGITVSAEDVLSALVEEELEKLFAGRHQRHSQRLTRKDKELQSAVRLGKERAKAWREATAATRVALKSVRKQIYALVEEELDKLFAARRQRHSQRLTRKDKELQSAVRLGKERAKAWREAAATRVALESVRKQIHDDLRIQHPEWVQPDGESPICDSYEARLAELLDQVEVRRPTASASLPSA